MSLFGEIKRRKVFRTAAAYLVIAWVIIEVATTVQDPLRLPSWFSTIVIVLLALGFPFAIVFSWAYDVSKDGVIRDDEGKPAPAPLQIDYGKIALVAVVVLGAFLFGNWIDGPDPPPPGDTRLQRYLIERSSTVPLDPDPRWVAGLSPDGFTIVIEVVVNGVRQLFSRRLDELKFSAIPNTENTSVPFAISPDGQSILFQDTIDGLLKKTTLSGAPPVPLGNPNGQLYGTPTWGDNGYIVFSIRERTGLSRLHENGGEVEVLTSPDAREDHTHPSFIPGSDVLLVTFGERGFAHNPNDRVAFVTTAGDVHITDIEGAAPQAVSDKQLLYFNRGAIWTAKFDLSNFTINREPQPVVNNVNYRVAAMYDVSEEGSLLYQVDESIQENWLVWVDRKGNEEFALVESDAYIWPSIAPNGNTLVVLHEGSAYGPELWAHSLTRGTRARLTNDLGRNVAGPFSPDARTIFYSGTRKGDIFRTLVSGDGEPEQLTDTPYDEFTHSITADGMSLITYGDASDGTSVFNLVDLSKNPPESREIWRTDYPAHRASLSPDGNWLLFTSEQSGRAEIYARPFPAIDSGLCRISTDGGESAEWGREGREIFYESKDALMSVAMSFDPECKPEAPVELFKTNNYITGVGVSFEYDRTRDKFLFVRPAVETGKPSGQMILVKNWPVLLEKRPQ